jgi:hypothetical protein
MSARLIPMVRRDPTCCPISRPKLALAWQSGISVSQTITRLCFDSAVVLTGRGADWMTSEGVERRVPLGLAAVSLV